MITKNNTAKLLNAIKGAMPLALNAGGESFRDTYLDQLAANDARFTGQDDPDEIAQGRAAYADDVLVLNCDDPVITAVGVSKGSQKLPWFSADEPGFEEGRGAQAQVAFNLSNEPRSTRQGPGLFDMFREGRSEAERAIESTAKSEVCKRL